MQYQTHPGEFLEEPEEYSAGQYGVIRLILRTLALLRPHWLMTSIIYRPCYLQPWPWGLFL